MIDAKRRLPLVAKTARMNTTTQPPPQSTHPPPGREEALAHAYEVGRHAAEGAAVLAISFAAVVVLLMRWRRRHVEAERRDALDGKLPRATLPFAAVAGVVTAGFLGLALIGAVIVQRSFTSSSASEDRASSKHDVAAESDGFSAVVGESDVSELSSVAVVLDDAGVAINGKVIEGTQTLPVDGISTIEPVVAQIHALYDRRESLGLLGPMPAHVTISPDAPATRAGALLATVGRMCHSVILTVGATTFHLNYLPSSTIPIEAFFYVEPRSGGGYALERQRISRDVRTHDPGCRERTKRRDLSSDREVRSAAAQLCAGVVDCVDHIEFALSRERYFGEVAPWMATALELLRSPDLRVVAEGSEPFPNIVACVDGGGSVTRKP